MSEADTCRKFVVPKLSRPAGTTTRIRSPSSGPSRTAASCRSERASSASRRSGSTTCCATPGISRSPSSRRRRHTRRPLMACSRRSEYAEMLGRQIRLCDQRPRNHRIRLLHRPRAGASPTTRRRPSFGSAIAARADRRTRQRPIACSRRAITRSARATRYYQQIAINRAVEAILKGNAGCCSRWRPARARPSSPFRFAGSSGRRAGTGRASTAARASSISPTATFSWMSRRTGSSRPSATRGYKIEGGEVVKSREMYFAIYQALAEDERRVGLVQVIPAGFLRPDHRRRVPPRQRPRRQHLARDPRIFRARLSSLA